MSRASRPRPAQRTSPSPYATSWPTVAAVGGLLLVVACGVAVSFSSGKRDDALEAIYIAMGDIAALDGVQAPTRSRRVIRELAGPTRRASNAAEEHLAAIPDLPPRYVPRRLLASRTSVVTGESLNLDELRPPFRAPLDALASRDTDELLTLLGAVQPRKSRQRPPSPTESLYFRNLLGTVPATDPPLPEPFVRERVAQVDLDAVRKTAESLRKQIEKAFGESSSKSSPIDSDRWLAFAEKRPDLQGLPFRKGKQCRLDRASAALMAKISRDTQRGRMIARRSRKVQVPYSPSDGADETTDRTLFDYVARAAHLHADKVPMDQAVRGVVQILQAESKLVRLSLVEKFLAEIDGPQATAALAQRALFDLSKEVRQAAVGSLKQRPRDDYRDKLLAGFRYPWAPVADHAAHALVGVEDKDAAPDLVELLDQPDPAAPFLNKENRWAVRELVRINHLRNCMLCHAPSTDSKDLVRGVVPKYGERLPQLYYHSRSGVFVRADVTYLKQDFSLMHPVPNPGKWPGVQRFDYLVRERELTAKEIAELVPKSGVWVERSYPQREAALYALRKLTGLDGGRSAAKWRALLGR